MKNLAKTVGLLTICLSVFYLSYRLTDRYLDRFRRNYITIENEHISV